VSEEATTEKVKYSAHDMRERLRTYHEGPEWVLQFEVGNATGGRVTNHADAVAMSIWPSRGYKIIGYEIKVNRSDWLNELKQLHKADAVGKFCDAWFLVAPTDIVHEVEVPESWGWMVPAAKSLRIKKQPAIVKAQELDRAFIAAMLRRSHGEVDAIVAQKLNKLRVSDRAENQRQIEQALKNRMHDYEQLKKAVAKFEEQSGLKIESYGGGDLGSKVKMLEAISADKWDGIPALIKKMQRHATELEAAYQKFTGSPAEKDHDT
jgi:hypothetical protein